MDQKEFYTIDEAAEYIGWNRATVFEWVKALDIERHRFLRNKKTYLARADVEKLKEIKGKPWTAGEEKKKKSVA